MKKRQHKWFRNERYKQKLERDVDNHKTYYSNVFFITKEPDYEYINRKWNERWRIGGPTKESGNTSLARNVEKITMFTMTVRVFPTPFSTTISRPAAVHVASTSKREPTSVCVKDGSSMVKYISTMNTEKPLSFGGNWTNKF